jgi:hypothetical protein
MYSDGRTCHQLGLSHPFWKYYSGCSKQPHYTNSHLWSHWNQATPTFQQGRRLADQSSVEDHCLCAKGMQRMPQSSSYRLRSMPKMCAPPLQIQSGPLSGLNLSPIFPTPDSASPHLTYRFHKHPTGYHSITVDIYYKYQQGLWDSHFALEIEAVSNSETM